MVDPTTVRRSAGGRRTDPRADRLPAEERRRPVRRAAGTLAIAFVFLIPLSWPTLAGASRTVMTILLTVGFVVLAACWSALSPLVVRTEMIAVLARSVVAVPVSAAVLFLVLDDTVAHSAPLVLGLLAVAAARILRLRPSVDPRAIEPVGYADGDAHFREVFDLSPVGMALIDEERRFVEVNPALCALLGRSRSSLIGRVPSEFTHPDDLAGPAGRRSTDSAETIRRGRRMVRPDGEVRWGRVSVAPAPGPQGQSWSMVHIQDVTESRRMESVLRQSQATLSAVARVARCVQSGEDPRPVLASEISWLAQAASISLLEATPPIGAPEATEAGMLAVTQCIGNDLAGAQVRLSQGAAGRSWLGGRPEFFDGPGADNWGFGRMSAPAGTSAAWWQPITDDRRVIAVVAVTWDRPLSGADDPSVVAVQALAEEAGSVLTAARIRTELQTLADTDSLTALPNRRGWQARLRELTAAARQAGDPLTLALVDLDHLKLYNDTYGHQEGDVLLRTFAARARAMLRRADVIARWGGEEFAIGLPGCSAADAGPLLDRLRGAMPDGQTCSIGHATLLATESAADCLSRADAMLYRAKREGRNRIVGAPDVESPVGS